MNEWFGKFAARTAEILGSAWIFLLAVGMTVAWLIAGPFFGWSDSWQLVANTGTTVITYLMVFIIQNTQNRDAKAIHLKLDELIRGVEGARTGLVDLEHLSDDELKQLQAEFQELRERRTAEDEEQK